MAAFTVEVDGVEYRGETAPATKQWDALHLALNSKLVLGIKEGVSDQALVMMLMSMSRDDLSKLESLLLKDQVTRESDGLPVASNLFRDEIQNYALLLGKVASENLKGFYTLRANNGSAGASEQ